uniref:G protein-coupled receptor kinase n=1 Tax=Castor canadensis TaxID=51338 RepID=A0A8C0XH53_CASCN
MEALDNLIANMTYLQARDGDSRELRRQHQSLVLPGPQDCAELHRELTPDFHSLCQQQPIGRRLFRDFLATVPSYQVAADFLEEVCSWELADPGSGHGLALQALLVPVSSHPFPSPALATRCQAATTEEELAALVVLAKAEATAFLQDQPLRDFLASPFYDKSLQGKLLERQPVCDKDFTEFRLLGRGGFGEVCAVQGKNTGKMYACKKLDKKRLKKRGGEKMALLEKEVLERVSSPFIVSLACAFQTRSHFCLVMSLMAGGDLKFHIYCVGERGLSPSRVVFYAAQMACGLLHLHSLGILYRDLKPKDVLLDDGGSCRLSDLGLAVHIQDDKPITQRAGTSGYMAPEILMEKVSYSYPVDWFAMGCSIYEMVAGRTPFRDYKEQVSKEDLRQRTLKEEVSFQHGDFTNDTKDICRLLLAEKPEQRLGSRDEGVAQVKHPFFKSINFPHLEAGLVEPPICAGPFGEVLPKICDGAVPIAWQEEIIETGLFEELSDPNRPAGCSSRSGTQDGPGEQETWAMFAWETPNPQRSCNYFPVFMFFSPCEPRASAC